MTKLQKAIKLAVENGYMYIDAEGNQYYDLPDINTIALDPQFWEALGKGLGWEDIEQRYCKIEAWKPTMNDMIPHLQQGGTVEEYISSLID